MLTLSFAGSIVQLTGPENQPKHEHRVTGGPSPEGLAKWAGGGNALWTWAPSPQHASERRYSEGRGDFGQVVCPWARHPTWPKSPLKKRKKKKKKKTGCTSALPLTGCAAPRDGGLRTCCLAGASGRGQATCPQASPGLEKEKVLRQQDSVFEKLELPHVHKTNCRSAIAQSSR